MSPDVPPASFETLEVRPAPLARRVIDRAGRVLTVPADWALLPPGDAALSRRIKLDGPSWTVVEVKGNKRFSRGIWAPAARIEALRQDRAVEQADPAYQRKLDAARRRRAVEEAHYAEEFADAVWAFLRFHPVFSAEARTLARLIAAHATPVGSGTVARTERIPVEERAEAATIAWLRHQTTGYDSMVIARVKGERREVRRQLARRSVGLLERYRAGAVIDQERCPLFRALRPHLGKGEVAGSG